uniref:Uncharacterized protein n=1 Tax=Biomphalaria glabrata TaxID=6526 RepID=A0A2C9M9Q1_BIOGL
MIIFETADIIILETSNVIILKTSNIIILETSDINILETSNVIILETSDINILETLDIIILETSNIIILETSDIIILETSDIIILETLDIIILETLDIIILETSDCLANHWEATTIRKDPSQVYTTYTIIMKQMATKRDLKYAHYLIPISSGVNGVGVTRCEAQSTSPQIEYFVLAFKETFPKPVFQTNCFTNTRVPRGSQLEGRQGGLVKDFRQYTMERKKEERNKNEKGRKK